MGHRIVDWVEAHRPLFFITVAAIVVAVVLVVNLLRDEEDDLDYALRGCRLLSAAYDPELDRDTQTRLAADSFEEFEQADEEYPRRLALRVFAANAPPGIGQRLGEWCADRYPDEFSAGDFRS